MRTRSRGPSLSSVVLMASRSSATPRIAVSPPTPARSSSAMATEPAAAPTHPSRIRVRKRIESREGPLKDAIASQNRRHGMRGHRTNQTASRLPPPRRQEGRGRAVQRPPRPPAGEVWARRVGATVGHRGRSQRRGHHPRRPLTSVAGLRSHGDASWAAGCARAQELQVVHGGADHRAPLTPPPRHPQRATRWPETQATTQATHALSRWTSHHTVLVFRRDHSSASPRSWARTAPANPT